MSFESNPLHRAVVVKKIIELFYEEWSAKRNYTQIFKLYTYPLFGICKSTARTYRLMADDKLKTLRLPAHLVEMFRLDIMLVKIMPLTEAAKVLCALCKKTQCAIERAKDNGAAINAANVLKYLDE